MAAVAAWGAVLALESAAQQVYLLRWLLASASRLVLTSASE